LSHREKDPARLGEGGGKGQPISPKVNFALEQRGDGKTYSIMTSTVKKDVLQGGHLKRGKGEKNMEGIFSLLQGKGNGVGHIDFVLPEHLEKRGERNWTPGDCRHPFSYPWRETSRLFSCF